MAIVLKAVVLFVVTFCLQLVNKISAEAMISSRSVRTAPSLVECDDCELRGDISIGSTTKLHRNVTIIAEAGPIIIGHKNVIKEGAVILNRLPPGGTPFPTPLYIGNNNIFKEYSHIEALKIGNKNTFESKCFVGRCVELGNACTVGEGSVLTCGELVVDNSTMYRRTLEMDFLPRVLPNYYYLK